MSERLLRKINPIKRTSEMSETTADAQMIANLYSGLKQFSYAGRLRELELFPQGETRTQILEEQNQTRLVEFKIAEGRLKTIATKGGEIPLPRYKIGYALGQFKNNVDSTSPGVLFRITDAHTMRAMWSRYNYPEILEAFLSTDSLIPKGNSLYGHFVAQPGAMRFTILSGGRAPTIHNFTRREDSERQVQRCLNLLGSSFREWSGGGELRKTLLP